MYLFLRKIDFFKAIVNEIVYGRGGKFVDRNFYGVSDNFVPFAMISDV